MTQTMSYTEALEMIGAEKIECPVCDSPAAFVPSVPGAEMGGEVVCSTPNSPFHADDDE